MSAPRSQTLPLTILAAQQLERATASLDKELNNIVYEQEVKSKVITQSARMLSERGRARDNHGTRFKNAKSRRYAQ